jgi:dihydroorotate dehydrogenase electron transfer subunit
MPGQGLTLRGPIGRGFKLPTGTRRVALVALGGTPARLLPVARQALEKNAGVTLYADFMPQAAALRDLPLAAEVYPLAYAAEAAAWADYLAIDAPIERLASLPAMFGLEKGRPLACAGQVLVYTPMPCGGLAECGMCAVRTRKKWSLACKDGPVFDLADLVFG